MNLRMSWRNALRAVAASILFVPIVRATERDASTGEPGTSLTRTAPVTARVTAGGREKKVTLVGRTGSEVAFTDGGTPAGQHKMLKLTLVEEVVFELEIRHGDLYKAVRRRNWEAAAKILLPPLKPTLSYLDMANNNAAERVLEAGDYMMRAGEQLMRLAKTEQEEKLALEKYESAYAILKYARTAEWGSPGAIATLKGCKCLLILDKPKTAKYYFDHVDEPMPGDRAYGLYWLVRAEMDVRKSQFRPGMAAAVKSLCFENKDVDTFPDALLISAQCYEEMQQWHRARDVYYEVARVFPETDWADAAVDRLMFIMEKGLTKDEEKSPIESVFFGLKEDMNRMVTDLLEMLKSTTEDTPEEEDDFDVDKDQDNTEDKKQDGITKGETANDT